MGLLSFSHDGQTLRNRARRLGLSIARVARMVENDFDIDEWDIERLFNANVINRVNRLYRRVHRAFMKRDRELEEGQLREKRRIHYAGFDYSSQ